MLNANIKININILKKKDKITDLKVTQIQEAEVLKRILKKININKKLTKVFE